MMLVFYYEGFDKSGAKITGEVEAKSIAEARIELAKRGLLVKSIKQRSLEATRFFDFDSNKISLADIEFLTSELSVLLDAGLKIDRGIELLSNANKKVALAKILKRIAKEIKGGKLLSQALADLDGIFDPLYINLVSIGEATGKLADVFRELAKELSFKRELQQKISQALTYPMVILFVCMSSVFFIFNYVVPNMSGLFEGQSELPWYTSMLLSSSEWLISYQWYLLASIVAVVLFFLSARKSPEINYWVQKIVFRLPILRAAIILVERIRFNSGLAMMLKAGVAVDKALQLASGNIKNQEIQREIQIAVNKVKQGELLSACLRQSVLFPDFFASLLAVGEESGELARIFDEIASRSQKEFTQWVTRFTSLLEPILIVLMGGLVGGVVVIMMLSITTITDVGL
jgi:type II secretory pathway component PulF